jgi:hypothetical protein
MLELYFSDEIYPLARLIRRWEDNIKMDLREIDYEDHRYKLRIMSCSWLWY